MIIFSCFCFFYIFWFVCGLSVVCLWLLISHRTLLFLFPSPPHQQIWDDSRKLLKYIRYFMSFSVLPKTTVNSVYLYGFADHCYTPWFEALLWIRLWSNCISHHMLQLSKPTCQATINAIKAATFVSSAHEWITSIWPITQKWPKVVFLHLGSSQTHKHMQYFHTWTTSVRRQDGTVYTRLQWD